MAAWLLGFMPWRRQRAAKRTYLRLISPRTRDRLHPGDGPLDFFSAAYHAVGDSHLLQLMNEGRARDCSENITGIAKTCQAWYRSGTSGAGGSSKADRIRPPSGTPTERDLLDTLAIVLEAQGEIKGAKEAAFNAAKLVPDDVYLLWQPNRLQMA